jgi:ORF6N domain
MQITTIQSKIHEIRGVNVMLDFDLAILYETSPKRLKEAVRRNLDRFPEDFMFELTSDESKSLRTQTATLEKGRGKHAKYLSFAFTEQGIAMLSSILNSPKAIHINIQIIRTFVMLRQFALSHKELTTKLKELETKYDQQFNSVAQAIDYLLKKDQAQTSQQNRKKIGFK